MNAFSMPIYDAERAIDILKDVTVADKFQGNEIVQTAINTAFAVLKMRIPQKPLFEKDDSWGIHTEDPVCPVCGDFLPKPVFIGGGKKVSYCNHCGQAIDWSDEKINYMKEGE